MLCVLVVLVVPLIGEFESCLRGNSYPNWNEVCISMALLL